MIDLYNKEKLDYDIKLRKEKNDNVDNIVNLPEKFKNFVPKLKISLVDYMLLKSQ